MLAKSNTPEFGAGANTFNEVFGKTRNPWDTRMTCGGSSGGAAVALATGQVWLATGSDLGGSLRIPASFCSVVGLRPSPGRVPHGPKELPFAGLSVEGPMGRTVGRRRAVPRHAGERRAGRRPDQPAAPGAAVHRGSGRPTRAEADRVFAGPRHRAGGRGGARDMRARRAAVRGHRRVSGRGRARPARRRADIPGAAGGAVRGAVREAPGDEPTRSSSQRSSGMSRPGWRCRRRT